MNYVQIEIIDLVKKAISRSVSHNAFGYQYIRMYILGGPYLKCG